MTSLRNVLKIIIRQACFWTVNGIKLCFKFWHPSEICTHDPQLCVGGCLLVLYFRGADLTLYTSPEAVLPGGIPWPGCRKMFLRTQREIMWKTWPALPQGCSFPWEKSKDWGRNMAHFIWLRTGGWHFHKQENLKQPELLLKPSLCGTSVVVKWLQWGFLEESLAVGLSEGFWKPCVQFLRLVSFWRSFSESVSPWQVQRCLFQSYSMPIPTQVRLLIWAYTGKLWWELGVAFSPGCWRVGQGDFPGDEGVTRCQV